MVAILFMVGNNNESPAIVSELLDVTKNNRKPVYPMASEIPLILYSAEHAGIEWIRPEGPPFISISFYSHSYLLS